MSKRSITKAEEDEIHHAFRLFDTEETGKIKVKDLRDALEDGSDRGQILLAKLPTDEHAEMNLEEFTSLMTQRHDDGQDDMTRMFQLFDKEKKGYIVLADLRRIANELGENMSDDELQEMIERAALKHGGRVNLEEFATIMTKKLWA